MYHLVVGRITYSYHLCERIQAVAYAPFASFVRAMNLTHCVFSKAMSPGVDTVTAYASSTEYAVPCAALA